MDELILEVHQSLDENQFSKIQLLLNSCAETDGLNPFSEHAILHMQYGHETEVQHILCFSRANLVGYAHVDLSDAIYGPSIEVAVLPEFRRHGVGKKLIELIVDTYPSRRLRLWAHGLNTGASSLAASCGFKQVRTLLQMRRSLMAPIPPAVFTSDVEVRPFKPDLDLPGLLVCNQKAFSNHPEQGQWTISNFQQRTSETWFDPNGLKVAVSDNEIVGFGWTKVDDVNADSKLGEIYIVGVCPEWQKQGLGKAFTIDGLRYLRSLNLNTALLYVDADNLSAISLYESLGFSHWDTDTLFQLG